MRLGLNAGLISSKIEIDFDLILEAERLGYDSVWSAEAYGNDAIVPVSFIAARTSRIKVGTAIMQMPARAPALAAMTAMTLDALSEGRFVMGLGPSGPQVVEGWYGVPYGRPLTRTREYIEIVRQVLRREAPLTHEGFHYQIPYRGDGATGLGRPLKSILHGRADIPIYTAAVSPNGLACAGEVADGVFPLWMDPERPDALEGPLAEGLAKSEGRKREDFDLAPMVQVVPGDDLEKCRMPVKMFLALYIGGMGAREKNFYNDYARRLGYEEAARTVQDLYLDGKKAEATAAVPDDLVDAIALVGPRERIAERLGAWRESTVGTMILATRDPAAVRMLAELAL